VGPTAIPSLSGSLSHAQCTGISLSITTRPCPAASRVGCSFQSSFLSLLLSLRYQYFFILVLHIFTLLVQVGCSATSQRASLRIPSGRGPSSSGTHPNAPPRSSTRLLDPSKTTSQNTRTHTRTNRTIPLKTKRIINVIIVLLCLTELNWVPPKKKGNVFLFYQPG
jgi:hypothetical protein